MRTMLRASCVVVITVWAAVGLASQCPTTLDTSGSAEGGVSETFCVTGISHPALEDFTSKPGEVCGSI